jgi:predicted dehydrogenase
MIKVGIAGLGRQGMLHFTNCLHVEGVQVVAVSDKSERALARARSCGVSSVYKDYDEMFSAHLNLDAVIISMPNFLHLPSIESALSASFNVFIEKPLANSVVECQRIVDLVRKSGKKLMVGHNHRFYEVSETMKARLEKGYLGDVEVITAEEVISGPFSHPVIPTPVAEWWFDPSKTGGGVLADIGYHMIDLFRYFMGDAEVLSAVLTHRFNLPLEDGAILVLRSRSGTKGIINVGWYEKTAFPRFDFRLILHGNAGYLTSDELIPHNLYAYAAKEGFKNILRRAVGRKIKPLRYTYYYESYYKELLHFFDCIKEDSLPSVTAEDGLRAVEVIEKAYRINSKEGSFGESS